MSIEVNWFAVVFPTTVSCSKLLRLFVYRTAVSVSLLKVPLILVSSFDPSFLLLLHLTFISSENVYIPKQGISQECHIRPDLCKFTNFPKSKHVIEKVYSVTSSCRSYKNMPYMLIFISATPAIYGPPAQYALVPAPYTTPCCEPSCCAPLDKQPRVPPPPLHPAFIY